jgi:putative endonuclease
MPCMYILYSVKLDKYYVGASTELRRRLYEHSIGHSKFTSLGVPWQLAYKEEFNTLQEAKKSELKIKKMKSLCAETPFAKIPGSKSSEDL